MYGGKNIMHENFDCYGLSEQEIDEVRVEYEQEADQVRVDTHHSEKSSH